MRERRGGRERGSWGPFLAPKRGTGPFPLSNEAGWISATWHDFHSPSLPFPFVLLPSSTQHPFFFCCCLVWQASGDQKMPGATPRLWPLMLASLYGARTQTEVLSAQWEFFFFFFFFSPLYLLACTFPTDPVTLDVITAFNLRGIRLPLTDLTAFTTRASRRL